MDEQAWQEVEFREGPKEVPAYIAVMMAGLPTHTMTYEQALQAANEQMLQRYVASAYDDVIKNHFGGPR